MSRRLLSVFFAATLAAGLLGACGGGSHHAASSSTTKAGGASTTAQTTATPSTTAPVAGSTTTAGGSTTTSGGTAATTTPPATTGCVAADLTATFAVLPGSQGAGTEEARVVLTNKTATPCVTGGYVGMQLLGSGGTKLPTDVIREAGTLATLTVVPGASVSATARFSADVPGKGDNQTGPCQPVAVQTEITPPNGTVFLEAVGPDTSVCEQGSLQVMPLQAGGDAGAP